MTTIMKKFLLILLLPFLIFADDSQDNTLQFLAGKYLLIGQKPDSKETYSGTISFSFDEKKKILNFKRIVNGKNTLGTAKIEKALAGEAEVLRLRFVENKKEYEGTFLWRSDLDNYGRLSGYIYLKNNSTKSPGLEAYFIQQE
ncbi:MAG: hypothetical protein KBA66_06105 [Leptospiraceae bacterium]|nr:hypothetical protein [Leptospiraceae bacterium]